MNLAVARPFKIGLSIIIFLLFIGFIGTRISAQNPNQITLSISPTIFEINANPGDSKEEYFRIINGTDQDLTLTATAKNFTATGEEGSVNLTEEDTSFSLASWISINPLSVVIPARGSQTFTFTINVPENAEPGGHFGSVIVKTNPVQLSATGAAVSQEAGPLILVSVAGDVVSGGNIASFKPQKNFWEKGPVTLETRVENTGSVHFRPSGTITIKNMFGKQITTIDLEEKNVLPDSIRKLSNDWGPGFAVGKYTAELTLVFGNEGVVQTASTSFIIFPYKIIIPAFLGAILVVFFLIKFRKRIAAASRALAGK